MNLVVRPMREGDVKEADRIFRVAFGTFLGLPKPEAFGGDGSYIASRFVADPGAALTAELDGAVVGSNMLTCWGSLGFFGPLTVRPDLWDKGVARKLLEATVKIFDERGTKVRGLYTFAQSPKHVRLYQKYGFWPRFLNITLSKSVAAKPYTAERFTHDEVRVAADAVFPGLDPLVEVRSIEKQDLGATVVVRDAGAIAGFALVQTGKGSEAGSGDAYIKLGAVRPGPRAAEHFGRLLDACEAFAHSRGATKLRAGVHTSRLDAYRALIDRGWKNEMQGVSMIDPADGGGYDRPDRFILEDWR